MEKRDDFYIPEEMVEWIGLKKSQFLSELISKQEQDDLSFDEFPDFEDFIPSTIEFPDKVYERDEDGFTLRTYQRSFCEKKGFHQMVIGVMIEDQQKALVFIPILFFVSRKKSLVQVFGQGRVVKSPVLN